MMDLSGKNILVTGSSRGIGAGVARILSRQGAKVGVTFHSSEKAAQEVIESLEGNGHRLFQLNISDESSVKSCFENFLAEYGQIDGLVNNAGVTRDQLILRMSEEDFSAPLQTNLTGSFLCTKFAVKAMLKKRQGSIVNVTSVIGHTGNPGQCNYSASKAGLTAFSKSIAQEIGSRSIRVNSIAPGFISTDMTDELSEGQKKAILDKVPLKSLGTTDDVAYAAAFLLSDESKYITGQTIHVNGGMYMN